MSDRRTQILNALAGGAMTTYALASSLGLTGSLIGSLRQLEAVNEIEQVPGSDPPEWRIA